MTAAGRPADEPVAVIAAQRVIAASPVARAEGVRPGQRRREAQSFCPQLVVLPRDPGGEARAFEPVVQAVERLGAPVAVRLPGWAALETRGPTRYLGGEAALRAAVDSLLDSLLAPGAWRTGLADGPFAATLAAEVAGAGGESGKVVARGANAVFLAPLPIELLDRPELTDLLRRLGITTLGAFARLAERDVLARFGPDGAQAHRLARGLDERRLEGRHVPPELAVQAELDPPAERVDEAAFAARTLAVSLCERLAAGGLACNRLAVEVGLSGGERLRRVWDHDGTWGPALVAERLRWQLEAWLTDRRSSEGDDDGGGRRHATARGAARRGTSTLPDRSGVGPDRSGVGPDRSGVGPDRSGVGGVESLRLVPLEVAPERGRQSSLWGRSLAGEERVLRVTARLQGMLGAEAVLRPILVGGRSPVDQVRLVPFGDPLPIGLPAPKGLGAAGVSSGAASAPWPGCLPAPSPAVVLAGDTGKAGKNGDGVEGGGGGEGGEGGDDVEDGDGEVELLDISGRRVTVDGRGALSAPPRYVVTGRGSGAVAAWAGPWPADERWWDGVKRRRRARLQLLTDDGEAYLVSLERGRWHLEGIYD